MSHIHDVQPNDLTLHDEYVRELCEFLVNYEVLSEENSHYENLI